MKTAATREPQEPLETIEKTGGFSKGLDWLLRLLRLLRDALE